MSQENVETVRRIFEAWANGDFREGASDIDRDVVFVVSADFPTAGVFVGLDGVRDYIRDFLAQWETMTIEATDTEAVGDTVLAHVLQHAKGRASGVEVDLPHFMLFTFRGKAIVRIESVMDKAEALEALGLSE
jgi:ketosteroid isomerase-like protein